MATRAIEGRAPLANPLTFTLTPGMAHTAPLMRMLARFDRKKVEAFAEISIALLDLMDGDPEAEDNGDREPDDDASDVAWPEWRGRGEQRPIGTLHRPSGTPYAPHEDDEDDDADCAVDDEGCDDAEQGDVEDDRASELPTPSYGPDQRLVMNKTPIGDVIAFRHE